MEHQQQRQTTTGAAVAGQTLRTHFWDYLKQIPQMSVCDHGRAALGLSAEQARPLAGVDNGTAATTANHDTQDMERHRCSPVEGHAWPLAGSESGSNSNSSRSRQAQQSLANPGHSREWNLAAMEQEALDGSSGYSSTSLGESLMQ